MIAITLIAIYIERTQPNTHHANSYTVSEIAISLNTIQCMPAFGEFLCKSLPGSIQHRQLTVHSIDRLVKLPAAIFPVAVGA